MTTQAARPVAETATEDAAKRLIWLDSLRLVAGVSMVGLHATADAQGQPFAAYEPAERIFPMLLRAVIYTARTELFLIISIFLLLMAFERRPKSYGTVVSIQARRLLIPFVFWTVFFAFYGLIKADAFGYLDYAAERLTNPLEWFGFFILGDVKYHMHFIPTLFVLVLMFPLFHLAVSYPWLGILILAALLLKRDLDAFIYATFWGTEGLPYLVRAVKVATYAGYGLLAGAFLGIWQQVDWQVRASFLPLVLGLGGLLFALKLVATWKTVEAGAWPFEYTGGYWADFLMPGVLFAAAMAMAHRDWPPVLSRLAPYSFGIYLCHPIFLDLVEIALKGTEVSPTWQVTVKITCAVTLTSAFVAGLARVRGLAWTIGLGPLPGRFGRSEIAVKGESA